jgi:hypothetical protein
MQTPPELLERLELLITCNEYVQGVVTGHTVETTRMQKSATRIVLLTSRRNRIVEALEPHCTSISVR